MSKAAFLDRDGVINRKPPDGEYVTRWDDMHLLAGVAKAITLLNRAGFLVIVVSNQRCIAKGLLTSCALNSMHQRMCGQLTASGATVDDVYHCPHGEQQSCSCRKPQPGMLLDAARKYDIDLKMSWMIGDSEADVQAGRNAGCKTARLVSTRENAIHDADIVAPSLLDAVHQILECEGLNAASLTKISTDRPDPTLIRCTCGS